MVPPTPSPSNRLVRAATAEREDLRRHRERLVESRETLRAELARIDASLQEVDERDALLDRLTEPTVEAARADLGGTPDRGTEAGADAGGPDESAASLLRGPAIRRTAVEVLLRHPQRPEALHYRAWYEALREAGYAVAGKDPLAVFLTQLSRSPAVRKSSQSGVYELDRSAPQRLRHQLDRLHDELRTLTATPSATADLPTIRARRAELTTQIGHAEKALEEAEQVLAPPSDDDRLAAAS
jgi:hypothetical protein